MSLNWSNYCKTNRVIPEIDLGMKLISSVFRIRKIDSVRSNVVPCGIGICETKFTLCRLIWRCSARISSDSTRRIDLPRATIDPCIIAFELDFWRILGHLEGGFQGFLGLLLCTISTQKKVFKLLTYTRRMSAII